MSADHAKRGVGWERCLEGWHDRYRRDGLGVVFRTPPVVRVESRVTPDGRFRARWAGEGPPDFAGVILGLGAVVFDAKETGATRFAFHQIERHQARDLEAAHLAGGVAFIALKLPGAGWVLPWSGLGPLWWAWFSSEGRAERGTASILPVAHDWARRMPELGDWLGALR